MFYCEKFNCKSCVAINVNDRMYKKQNKEILFHL